MDAFDGVVDFLFNYKSGMTRDNSIVGMMQDLFKLSDNDTDAILDTFTHLINRVLSSKGPLMKLYYWMNSKFLGLMKDTFDGLSQVAGESLFGYDSGIYQFFRALVSSIPLLGLLFDSNDTILEKTQKKFKGTSLQSLNLQEIVSDERTDESQVAGLGKISAALQTELLNQKYDTVKTAEISKILTKINNAKGTIFDKLDNDDFVKEIAADVAKYRGITLDVEKVKDDVTGITGSNGIGIIKRTGPNKAIVKQTAIGDQTITGKEGGPIVSAIAYAGNAANALLQGMQFLMTPSNLPSSAAPVQSGPSEIRVVMQVDGNTLTEVCLDNDIIRKASERKNGRAYLADGIVVDAAGNSIQGSSLT